MNNQKHKKFREGLGIVGLEYDDSVVTHLILALYIADIF